MSSNLRQKMNKQKGDLEKRHQESIDRKEMSMFGSIFDKNKVPDDISFWKCGGGRHVIDIIPFIAGPDVPNKNAEEGSIEYVIDLWMHRLTNSLNDVFVCPTRTWGKPCPICEDLKANDYNDDYYKETMAKRRTVYLIWVHDTPKEEAEGIKILDIAHFFLQMHLDELAEPPTGKKVIIFSDIDKGKNIGFTRKGTGAGNTQFLGHKFIDRDEPIPDDICDQSFSLDACIKMHPSYDEIADAYFGKEDDVPNGELSEGVDESLPEEVDEVTNENDDVPMFSETEKAETPEETEEKTNECPGGGEFGIDTDTLDECKSCEIWDECAEEAAKKDREQRKALRTEKAAEDKKKEKKEDAPKTTSKPKKRVTRKK